jgi:hypothetical protein
MKKIITLALALFVSYAAMADLPFISMGVKIGLAAEKQKMDWGNLSTDMFNKATTGYHAGIVLRVDLPVLPIYFQPEILYNWSRIKSENADTLGDVKLSNFNVPLLAGVGFGSAKMLKLRANIGPVFNLASQAKIGDTEYSDLADALRKNTVTWTAGVGIDIIGIMFDVRYNGAFKKTKVNDITVSSSSWTFSLGYLF